jgi:2,4-dienoyl-CoA reductase-like NADH-dependent reductase (Old Yellow Enzyme family)/thioredoxin reductase
MAYESLFQPITIRNLALKNRLVMAPMSTQLAAPDGSVTQELVAYFEERAKGGVGMILPGYTFIDSKLSKASVNQLGCHCDAMVPGLNTVVESVRPYGTRIFLQLCHAGRQTDRGVIGQMPAGPSTLFDEGGKEVTRELTDEEIEEIIEAFGLAAKRAKQAGFDGVEIHGAHGYLINEFMSDYTNRRTDGYGGDVARRMRFTISVLNKVREYVGEDYPVGFRMNGSDYLETKDEKPEADGVTLSTAIEMAKILERNGVDYLHISAGIGETAENAIQPMYLAQGCNVYLAEGVKKAVSVPVIAVGSITGPDMAAEIISKGRADLVALGRALIADPHFCEKARVGRREEILHCIRCNECAYRTGSLRTIKCSVNPQAGNERGFTFAPALRGKTVLVVGGGPGGMEAARVAALRGHGVTLVEKEGELGGKLVPASSPSFKRDLKSLIDYFVRQMDLLGVKVILNQHASSEMIRGLSPDVVILATGSQQMVPSIPGIESERVYSSLDILSGKNKLRGQRVVVIGGGTVGCETAVSLAEAGMDVTVVEALEEILLEEPNGLNKAGLKRRLRESKVGILTGCQIDEVTPEGVSVKENKGNRRVLESDSVVLSIGFISERGLNETVERESKAVYSVGDCVEPRKVFDAIHEAARIANGI